MKKISLIVVGVLAAIGTMAQEITPYQAYQIKKEVTIEILEIKRVEKYGWDNLEIQYRLKNNSPYDLQKIDFFVHLLDADQKEIGSIELFAFNIDKASNKKYKSVEVLSPYVNESIGQHIVETKQIDVVLDEDGSSMVRIEGSEIKRK
ncbi:hypothetical protein [Reichenbachiella ulvae]|uniref:DUF5067 domain-containing protein n=1 Tax=Reichenbachiella ulvae TaxID=2980104 RepID=A0ABT3CUS4_9BACT|nr:hypothetical protein [Reichenbachiella ulvae]MCV9387225.1 hypothetical protein [Reichenbachiella ulvae]